MTLREMTLTQLADEYHCAMRSRTDRLAAAKAELERRQARVERLEAALREVISVSDEVSWMRSKYPPGTCKAEDAWRDFGRRESAAWREARAALESK